MTLSTHPPAVLTAAIPEKKAMNSNKNVMSKKKKSETRATEERREPVEGRE